MAALTICSDFGAPKIKSDTTSTVSPSISHEDKGPDAMILVLYFMLKSKFAYPLLWRKTLTLSSKIVFYVNIYEKMVCNEDRNDSAYKM